MRSSEIMLTIRMVIGGNVEAYISLVSICAVCDDNESKIEWDDRCLF